MTPAEEQIIYPEGRMHVPEQFSLKAVKDGIEDIKVLPRLLDYCIENLDTYQLETPYREGGWSTQQIVHHIADSHMNAFIRCKLALTEDSPVIKPYDQDAWVLTTDVSGVPVNYSVTLVHALHHRFSQLLDSLTLNELERCFYHPEHKKNFAIWQLVHMYAWHGKHHVSQIRQLRLRMGW